MALESEEFKEGFIEALIETGQTAHDAEESWKQYILTTVTKDVILGTVGDLVSNFLYYDRSEDENLSLGAIENAISTGTITVDEIVEKFRQEMLRNRS